MRRAALGSLALPTLVAPRAASVASGGTLPARGRSAQVAVRTVLIGRPVGVAGVNPW